LLKVQAILPLNRNQSAIINSEMNYPFTADDISLPFALIYNGQPDTASQYDCNYQNQQVCK
jgi:hypothetical protein